METATETSEEGEPSTAGKRAEKKAARGERAQSISTASRRAARWRWRRKGATVTKVVTERRWYGEQQKDKSHSTKPTTSNGFTQRRWWCGWWQQDRGRTGVGRGDSPSTRNASSAEGTSFELNHGVANKTAATVTEGSRWESPRE